MKALVIGYGSIGSRHTRVLKGLGCQTAVVSRRAIDFQPCYKHLAEALEKESPDYVVVANRTSEHHGALRELKENGFVKSVLVEKPLFSKEERFSPKSFRGVFVAYDLRFHPLVRHLKEILREEKVLCVQCYVGQYLPEWRPAADYRQGYSASKRQGGGVLRDLSHELDYLSWIFGPWKGLAACGGHYSHLEIDTDDVFCVLLSMSQCPAVTLHLNYLDRQTHREIRVNTDCHTFVADLIKGTLCIDKGAPKHFPADNDLTYRLEHQAILGSDFKGLCTYQEAEAVMKMMTAIETSAMKKQWMPNKSRRNKIS